MFGSSSVHSPLPSSVTDNGTDHRRTVAFCLGAGRAYFEDIVCQRGSWEEFCLYLKIF
jgi:hypothetical protein